MYRRANWRRKEEEKPEITRELNIDAVVEASMLPVGDRVRIRVQLIEAKTDRHLWANRYERNLRDVLALQSEVVRDIARQIKIAVTPEEQARLAQTRLVNPEAYQLYLKGRFFWNRRTEQGLKKGIEYFEKAIEKDPN